MTVPSITVSNAPTSVGVNYPVAIWKMGTNGPDVQMTSVLLPFISHVDAADPNNVYTGYAIRGALDSTASWWIMKTSIAGSVTTVKFAGDPGNFTQIWNNRASLTYT